MSHPHASKQIRIGGTDAATIMGVNKWRTPHELWQIKVGLVTKPNIPESKRAFGLAMEEFVIKQTLDHFGFEYSKAGEQAWVSNAAGTRVGYLDYKIDDETFIEAKTTSEFCRKDWANGVPEYYLWQIVHYFSLLPSATTAHVGCLIGNGDIVFHTVYRDDDMIDRLVRAEEEFLNLCLTNTEPEILVETEGKTYNMDADVAQVARQYIDIGKQVSELKKQQDELREALQAMVGIGNTQTGEGLAVGFKYRERKSLDEKALAEDYPEINLSKYKKTVGYYQLTAKEKK